MGRWELKASLRCSDAEEGKRRHAEKMVEFRALLTAARAKLEGRSAPVSPRQIAALVGEWYRAEAAKVGEAPGEPGAREVELAILEAEAEDPLDPSGIILQPEDRPEAERLLVAAGLVPDLASIAAAGVELRRARLSLARLAVRRARGDWASDAAVTKFPDAATVPSPSTGLKPAGGLQPLPASDLLAAWAAERAERGLDRHVGWPRMQLDHRHGQ